MRAIVTITADTTYLDLRLTLENETTRVVDLVTFPADVYANADLVDAGYAPNFLPGVRFRPSFFKRPGNNVLTYPSRWAFADYLAVDVGGAHLALYAVNPAPGPIAPVELGFIHNLAPVPCSGSTFCLAHAFETWVKSGHAWTSPVVRLRVGAAVEESIVAYRNDNGMDAYPSVAAKLGARLERLSRAPLIKADLWKGLPPFKEWKEVLERLPSPSLVHPVAFQPGGHDVGDPDFLPPDPR